MTIGASLGALLPLLALAFPQLEERFYASVTSEEVGELHVELFVGADGEVDDCTVLYSEFNRRDTEERICNQARQQSVRIPALDQEGRPVHGTVIYTYRTTVGGRDAPSILWRAPVLEIGVNRLPDGVDGRLLVGLKVIVDATGRIEACEANTREADAYTRAACGQLQDIPHPIRHDRTGQPVRYLTDMNVVFTVG